ncbi:MAG: hypothetical protein D6725_11085 [Planctomycetota bacterium]|nr:MAG: hypothetical protein D6725_11085 [Planctomycetota bacterium]
MWATRAASPRFPAIVQAERFTVSLPYEVRIERVLVRTGEKIHPGQPLLQFDLRPVCEEITELQRREQVLKVRRERLMTDFRRSMQWQEQQIAQKILQLKEQVAGLLEERYRNDLERIALGESLQQDAVAIHVAVPQDVFSDTSPLPWMKDAAALDDQWLLFRIEAARNAAEVANVRIALCEQRIEHLSRLRDALRQDASPPAEITEIDAELTELRDRLGLLHQRLKQATLASKTFGTVGRIACQPGQFVPEGAPLLHIHDNAQPFLIARLPVHGDAKDLQGRRVTVQFPTGTAGGRIEGVLPDDATADAAAFPRDQSGPRVFVRVVPSDRLWPDLPVGTTVGVCLEPDSSR